MAHWAGDVWDRAVSRPGALEAAAEWGPGWPRDWPGEPAHLHRPVTGEAWSPAWARGNVALKGAKYRLLSRRVRPPAGVRGESAHWLAQQNWLGDARQLQRAG